MKDKNSKTDSPSQPPEVLPETGNTQPVASHSTVGDQESRRWWIKLALQPLLLLVAGAALIVGLGLAQKVGWVSSGSGSKEAASDRGDTRTYICPMLCTPPQIGPGRCPVCEMELVPAVSGGGNSDSRSVQIDPASRRVANIRTVAVRSVPLARTIQAIGNIHYDEGSFKTISAYVDGRLDRLYANYTGVVVEQGDPLALVYSPRLYSGQVELLLARKARDANPAPSLQRVVRSNRDMVESTRQRLIELGMTQEQIEQLELAGEASSRMHLLAPIGGTVIQKYATEGQYVREGEAIYELADLSTVWLMLEMFPTDAAVIGYGQKVDAEVQSLPGRTFTGRVAFVDPSVDSAKRTVGVRVVIPNEDGLLRVGDYAKATVQVPLAQGDSLAIPRNAVLMAGRNSVVYVETEPGRFEIRHVTPGGRSGPLVAILKGLQEGEQVAVSGNFLIDSQMQLAGNPSLIDPNKTQPVTEIELEADAMPPIGEFSMEVVP